MLDILHLIFDIFNSVISFFANFEIIENISLLHIFIILSLFSIVFYFLKK